MRLTVLLATALFGWAAPQASAAVDIDVLSNRADLLSGGDALVAITAPDVSKVKVTLGSRDVTGAFAPRPDGRFAGLVTDIPNRAVRLSATLPDGSGSSVRLVGHPNGGPVFSGPQLEPWVCQETAVDPQCNQPPVYSFYAKTDDGFVAIDDPSAPPSGTDTATTDDGDTQPFVVRVETGYQDRDQYKVATLWDPAQPWEPWRPQKSWNRNVVITHGGSCGTDREAGEAPEVFRDQLLERGYIVMSTALNNLGHNCNPNLITESEIMLRERVVEQYGPVERTIGTGCSGGAIAQVMSAHAYPGFYDGITVQCTFADLLTTGKHAANGHLVQHLINFAGNGAGGPLTPADQAAIMGSPLATADDYVFDSAFWSNITGETGCNGLDDSVKWSTSNPAGERCGALDHNINVIGKGPTGFAGIPLDNTGLQYGLKALLDGRLTPAKFVDVNARIGGLDKLTYEEVPERTVADPEAITNIYRSGYLAIGNTLDQTPILEGRGPNEATAHVTYPTLVLRARLDRFAGSHASHALWQGPVPLIGQNDYADRMVVAMDRWVAAIQADKRDVPKGVKVRENRPADITDHCEPTSGVEQPGTDCPALNRFYESPTNAAGESMLNDVLKCQLKPLRREDYGSITFTDAEWAQLEATFPAGVCDFTKPGVGETETIPWLTYENKAGGEPMGDPPAARAFGKPVLRVRRARAALRRLRSGRRARVVLVKRGGVVPAVRVRLVARGRVVAASRARTLTKRRTRVVLRRRGALPRGAVRVRVSVAGRRALSRRVPGR